ncbi:tetracycline resistance MFS efflux pump [Gloeobacter kilaueensis]|nr:tetracycline resistance MFS efflux pump [Gloeobacter kilaueensis]
MPRSPLLFVLLTVFIDLMGGSLLVPVLPYLVERFRSDALTIGLLTSSFSIAQFLATPVLGTLSDRFGRRPVLLICVFGTSVGYFLFALANQLWVLFLARTIAGATGGVVSTAQAYIADTTPPEKRTGAFGLIGAAFGLGFILGPAIGGALVHFDLNAPVYFAGALALFNLLLGSFTLKESLPPEKRQRRSGLDALNPFKQLSRLVGDGKIRGLLVGFFLFNFAFAGFTSIFALSIKDRFGWGPAQVVWVFAFIGVVSTFVQGWLIRQLVPRFGEPRLALSGLGCICFAFALIALIPAGSWLYLTQGVLALGVGLATPSLRGLLSNTATASDQGRVLGGAQSLVSLGQVLGPLAASSSYDYLGQLVPFWGGAVTLLLALGFVFLNLRVLAVR